MPYYNDVPYYYGGGAYANHSSLMTGIVRMPFHTSLSRFSPHLSTISESPLSHLHRFSPISVRSTRRVIDTADIDVSSSKILSHNRNPSKNLRRDRPTIKIRSQALKDNPALREHYEKHEKSVGELLMEKFFIKDKKLVDNDSNQQKIHLDHQINLDRLENSEEREAVQKRITRRFTRRRSSSDLQLNSEQMQREAAYAQVQAKVLDSLVAEEQAQIENETRRGTSMFKKGTTAKGLLEHPCANNIDSDMMIQEEEQAAMTRIKKTMKKTKKKRFVDKLSSIDKIDKRQSSTSSKISIDSQITKNDESRPQIYKIEACNSAGDFSTFWMNTNAENKRCKSIDEKFKESIRVSIPNRFGTGNEVDVISNDANETETQVVLTVQKSYVKDTSRNSVRLTIKKPTEKLTKKLKEIEKFDVKANENQLNLTKSFIDIENNILTNNISKSLTDVDSVEPNYKIQMTNNIKDFKALRKAVYKSKNMESLARNDIPISKDDSSNNRDTNILATKSNMREIITEDSSFSKETETTPIQSNILAFISTNPSRNDSQIENFRGILEDTFIAKIKNNKSQKDYLIDNITKKIFDYSEVDSTIKTPKVFIRKNSVASVESDKFISEKLTSKSLVMPHNENMIKQNIIKNESSDIVGKNNISDTMLTINSAICRLPKLSKINTDRNNAVEAPKLPLREAAEYQVDSLKSDHDVETAAVVLPEKKMNKTSNLAQVSSFNASKRTNNVDAYKLSYKIDATRHNKAVKLEANETTLPKETNDKVYSSEYCDEAKLAAGIKPTEDVSLTKTSKNNAKGTDENILTLKTIDSSNIEIETIFTEADAKEAELKTDSIKKINCIDVGKDSLKDLSNFKSKMPILLENNTNETGIANLSNIGKDLDAFNIIKIENGKSFLCDNANDETRILKKNMSVDSSKLMNDHSANNISKVFQQSVSNDEKATDKDISVKMSKTKSVNKIIEKKSMKTDSNYNFQDESIILSRSTSTESIDFWSEIKAPNSPEMTRSKQQNGFPLRETNTSKIEKNMNSMNLKRKGNEKKIEIDVKMSTTTFESSIDGFSNIIFEKEKEKKKNVSKSLILEKTEKEKLAKTMEIEKNMPTVQKIPSKKKNFSIMIDTKNTSPIVKKASLKCNNFGTTSVTTSVEVIMPEINIVEASKLFKECDNRKIEEEHENPSTPTNELSFNPSLIRKISRWSNQDDLTNIDDVETPVISEEISLVTSPSVSPLQSSKTKHAIKKKKPSIKKALLEKSEKGLKEICNNELITSVNERNMFITKLAPEKQHLVKILPKTSPKSSPKNTPLQRPLDLMKIFYTTPSALLTATPRDLSKVRRAKIKRRRHHSRTPSISSDSTESTTSTITTRSTENGSTRVELNDDSKHKRMNSTRSNDSGFDGSPRILRRIL